MPLGSRFLGWILVLCLLGDIALAIEAWNILQDDNAANQDPQWDKIQASPDLKWQPCYRTNRDPSSAVLLECAKLEIPLDWNNTADPARVALAVVRKPARNTTSYKGPIFLNPGGPGSSGVTFIVGRVLERQLIPAIGEDYDIVSWDPRGVGFSTPAADCWDDTAKSFLWAASTNSKRLSDAEPENLYRAYATAKALSAQCESAMNRSRLLQFVGATYDVRDLLELVHKYDNATKLNYWGFSYGTVIGSLFAAMYPNKVGRIVNDGNVNVVERFGPYKLAIREASKVSDEFYRLCSAAGASKCAIYEKTAEEVKARVQRLKEKLTREPLLIPTSFSQSPGLPVVVSWADVEDAFYSSLYSPNNWPEVSTIFARLENGTITEDTGLAMEIMPQWSRLGANGCLPDGTVSSSRGKSDANAAVVCADALPIDGGLKGFEAYVSMLKRANPEWAMTGANSRLSCAGRTVRPKWRYSGLVTGNTSHPILFVGNRYDAITPLQESYNSSSYFPGSVVLLNDGYGHTSLNSPSTNCTVRYIKQYFQDGTLPASGTVCKVDTWPFGLAPS